MAPAIVLLRDGIASVHKLPQSMESQNTKKIKNKNLYGINAIFEEHMVARLSTNSDTKIVVVDLGVHSC